MTSRDSLIGGVKVDRKRRSSRRVRKSEPVPVLGYGFFFSMVAIGAMITAGGLLKVHTVFEARDLEMETRRLQEVAQEKRDRYKVLNSRLSSLRRMEVLRGAAQDSLGMIEPAPQAMTTLTIDEGARERWRLAALAADAEILNMKEEQ